MTSLQHTTGSVNFQQLVMQHSLDGWNDEEFVQAVCSAGAHRDAALEWWFNDAQLHQWVRNYVTRYGGNIADADDLYHDTFIAFDQFIRMGRYRGEAALKTVFCSIAKWQWVNARRRMAKTEHRDEWPETAADWPENEWYTRERASVLNQLLTTLGDKCKKLLTMYQLNYTMKETASEMGYASDQVAMNETSGCRKKLKTMIEKSTELMDFLNRT